MSKYNPFGEFLGASRFDRIRLTFAQIEGVLGFNLPHSRRYNAWWSNNTSNSVFTAVWLAAGFKTCDVDPISGRVTFQRVA